MSKLIRFLVTVAAVVALCAASASAEPRVIVNTDFANSRAKINFKVTDTKDISGKVPVNWSDNSEWNTNIAVSYTPTTEHDISFLRIEKTDGARAQMAGSITKKTPAGTYRFQAVLKSPTSTTPEIGVRLNDDPYTYLWVAHPTLDDTWTTIDEEFVLDDEVKKIGIYVCIMDNGVLDVKSVELQQE